MPQSNGSQQLGLSASRLPMAAALALALLGGSSPRGAELVPFRGIEPEEVPLFRAAQDKVSADGNADLDSKVALDFAKHGWWRRRQRWICNLQGV